MIADKFLSSVAATEALRLRSWRMLLRRQRRSTVNSQSGGCSELRPDGSLWAGAKDPHRSPSDDEQQRDELGRAHDAAEHRTAIRICAQELEEIARDAVQEEIGRRDLAFEVAVVEDPQKKKEDQKLGREFVNLRRVQPDAERCSCPLCEWVGEGHTPGKRCWFPKAAPGGKAAEAPDGMAYRDARRKGICGFQFGKMMADGVPVANRDGEQQSAGKDAA